MVEFNWKCQNQSNIQSFLTIYDQIQYIFYQIGLNNQHKDDNFWSVNQKMIEIGQI